MSLWCFWMVLVVEGAGGRGNSLLLGTELPGCDNCFQRCSILTTDPWRIRGETCGKFYMPLPSLSSYSPPSRATRNLISLTLVSGFIPQTRREFGASPEGLVGCLWVPHSLTWFSQDQRQLDTHRPGWAEGGSRRPFL